MRPGTRVIVSAALALLAAACGTDLGECDEALLGGDEALLIPHAGQLVVQQNCAAARCHTADARGELRSGAPAELDFDVVPRDDSVAEKVKVREGHERVQDYREAMWSEIDSGDMPPPPPAGGGELDADDKETVRNWLACGAPVIAAPPPESEETDWSNIYADLIGDCVGCHAGTTAILVGGNFELGVADDPCAAHGRVVSAAASGTECGGSELTLVVPGEPEMSLLVRKLTDEVPPCGSFMPYMPEPSGRPLAATKPQLVERLRSWIADGALAPECD